MDVSLLLERVGFYLKHGYRIILFPFGKNGEYIEEVIKGWYGNGNYIRVDNYKDGKKQCISVEQLASIKDKIKPFKVILTAVDSILNKELYDQLLYYGIKADNPYDNAPLELEGDVIEKENVIKMVEYLRPQAVNNYSLVRIGALHDGGYVMLDDFECVKAAYSIGISDEISWDQDISKKGILVHMYDHTIDGIDLGGNCLLDYHHKGISRYDLPEIDEYTLESMIKLNNDIDSDNLVLKIDVEGAEYESLLFAPDELIEKFKQISIEFHDLCDMKNFEKKIKLFEKINKTHQAVWVHGNNYSYSCSYNGLIWPNVLEVTYVRRKDYSFRDYTQFLFEGLNMPNNPEISDYNLDSWNLI